jgi:hypothetical protein
MAEMWRNFVIKKGGNETLTNMFNKTKNKKYHKEWQLAILSQIYKNKGKSGDCTKYRGTSLLLVMGKIFFH